MIRSEGRPTREGKCVVCETISDECVQYSADDFKRVVRRGLLPPEERHWLLALDARPPKRDAFGNRVVVISTDMGVLRNSVTAAEERAAVQGWRNTAKKRDTEALLCPICDGRAREFDFPGFFERIAKMFRK